MAKDSEGAATGPGSGGRVVGCCMRKFFVVRDYPLSDMPTGIDGGV